MPQSLANVLIHIVFSTKDRSPQIGDFVRDDLHAFLAGTVRAANCQCLRVGGVADHVHLAIRLHRVVSVAALVEDVKTASSKWLKPRHENLRAFAWQRGYAALSFGPGEIQSILEYIAEQEQHHRRDSFQAEYRALLEASGVPFDERYIWD